MERTFDSEYRNARDFYTMTSSRASNSQGVFLVTEVSSRRPVMAYSFTGGVTAAWVKASMSSTGDRPSQPMVMIVTR